jgi:Ser/Thr protein kinase RdoA (MazF antagonist)/AraC-like DNA-binding protein
MQIPDIIQTSLDYIEKNLKTDITAGELAAMAGYSVYHYCRIFSSVMDSSVAYYITKRRLDHSLSEISRGRKAIDVVLEYGFGTYAGFYKAFTRMYGCSPKKYLSIYPKHTPKIPEVVKKHMYTERELRKILENWDVPKNLPIGEVRYMRDTKIADDTWTIGDDYQLHVDLKGESREKITKDMNLAKALAKQGFASALPVPTKTGSDYLEGEKPFILTRRLRGAPLGKSERFGENRAAYGEKYGRSLAKLHKALRGIEKAIKPDVFPLFLATTEWAIPSVRCINEQRGLGLNEELFTDYTEVFEKLYDKLPKQLVHRNPCPDNILFENGEVTGFINFDLCETNIRLFDVCYCATGLMSETDEENYEKWLDVLGGILRGYDSEGKLTPEEKQAVFYVILSIELHCVAAFEGKDEFDLTAGYNRKMLQFVAKKKDEISRII